MADFLKSLKIKGIEIDPAGATTDQILKYNGTKFVPATGGGGASNIDDLGDVTITSAAAGDYLTYNGTAWINDAAPSYLQLDTSVGSPTSVEGKIQWDSDFGTVSFGLEGNNSVQQIGINQFAYCYNADSVTLTKGTPVYIFGGQGSQVSIKRALNTGDATSATTLGLVSESIAAGASGYVCTYGVLQGIDTTAYNEGDILYLGATAGTLTTTKPSAPNHYVFVGVVIKDDVGGEIWIRPQNGYELDEIHNVSINAGTLASGDFLKYNGTLWVNDPINLGTDTVGNYMTDVSAGSGISISHTPGEGSTATISLDMTATLPSGSVQMFAGSSAPAGWMLCNGSAVSRTTYSSLFSAIGTTFGSGDGSTTFNIPDMRGRMAVGVGTGTGLTARTLNGTGGVESVTLTGAQSGTSAHGHGNTISASTDNSASLDHSHASGTLKTSGRQAPSGTHGHSGTTTAATAASTSTAPNQNLDVTGSTAGTTSLAHTHTVNISGGVSNSTEANASQAHENMPPFIGMNFIIKV